VGVRRAQRIVLALLLVSACRKEEQPAAHVSIQPANIVVRHGHCATVTLQWEMLRPLDRLRGQPFVFVHLLERAHKVKVTFDHPLPAQASAVTQYPFDICLSAIAPPVEPGRYILGAGLFDSEWGYRWPLATPGANEGANQPDEIYFDLTQFAWYREGRALVHIGRSYMPMSDPTPVDVELREAGSYEGVTYYAAVEAPEPVYTLYVPVYYRYWQRFTAPPGT
jgi:hypothetical protein